MKPFSFAAAVCLPALLFLSEPVFADNAPDSSERRAIPPLKLEEQIVDLIETIEDEAPEVYRRMSELPRKEALARVMRALDSGVVPVSSSLERSPSVPSPGNDSRNYPVFGLTERMFPYLRFDAVTPDILSQAVRELKTVNGGTAPAGMVVDLREAGAGGDETVNVLSDAIRELECPVMVLISGRTKGPGELLAAILRRDCGAVLIGTETAGSVFPVKRIYVNDVAWFVPNPPTQYSGISPYALKPDLEKSSDARLSFDQLKEKTNSLDGDPVLRLAADLLTMKAAVRPVEQSPSPAQ